jgi:hypothetical protein
MKNLTKTTLTMLTVGLLSGGLFCQQAQAVQVNGTLFFGGVVTLDSTSVGSATQVTTWNTMFVSQPGTGSFSGIPVGTSLTMSGPWTFNSGSHPALWSVGGFTFDLTSSSIIYQISTFLNVSGPGIVSGNGFTPSTADWAFTIVTDGTPHGDMRFAFTAQIFAEHPPGVPDSGATVTLFGVAFVGIAGLRRKVCAL